MTRPRQRRGVLLLVVLSMLVLFMLIGTAFLMTSSQYRTAAVGAAKADRVGTPPNDLLDRALMQVLRDSSNPYSAIRYHSLLRDMYGTGGFEAVVYSPATMNLTTPVGQVTRFAGATNGTAAQQLGPTQGQFVDIYVRALAFNVDDRLTLSMDESSASAGIAAPDARHVLKLERDARGQLQQYELPLTGGYFNGCLLTVTSGPARGQSARIVDYQYISDFPTTGPDSYPLAPETTDSVRQTRLFRFRVMAFPRADGRPLQVSATRPPELSDLAGATFIVNGRPYSGTGVGYNPLAYATDPNGNPLPVPRLSAVEIIGLNGTDQGAELALLPNAKYFNWHNAFSYDATTNVFTPLNNSVTGTERYPSYVGFGDANESYDAADFQNMALALQTVTPRSQGRVQTSAWPEPYEVDDPLVTASDGTFVNNSATFLRLDLEDLPLPSFHRPALINFWYHRLLTGLAAAAGGPPTDDMVRAILQPYGPNGIREESGGDDPNIPVATRDQIVALKRQFMLRPLHEDNPDFDGSNPQSVPGNLADSSGLVTSTGRIAVPFWEATGPWDVDNDSDGVPESVWVDLGDPVQAAEDGTLYKPLYAMLIVDLDSRLNVNAHGTVDDILPPNLDPTQQSPGNLAHDTTKPAVQVVGTSNLFAQGIGYSPAEISLRPVFPMPIDYASGNPLVGNRLEDFDGSTDRTPIDAPVDSYATLLAGRITVDGQLVTGRHGIDPLTTNDVYYPSGWTSPLEIAFDVAPGITAYAPGGLISPPDILAQYKFFGYPNYVSNYFDTNFMASAFGTPPDLTGRYALGLDYTGQPVYEYTSEYYYNDRPVVADSPLELDLSGERRRDTRADGLVLWANMTNGTTDYLNVAGAVDHSVTGMADDTDDAPFATADLERVLRAYDADAGSLPSRLWDVVGAFDPLRLAEDDPYRVQNVAQALFPSSGVVAGNSNSEPQMLVAAQQISSINRRLVTTDSYDLPVPGGSVPNQATLALGADGMPGRAGVDDDGNGVTDYDDSSGTPVIDPNEIGYAGSDDFSVLFGKSAAQATIVDLLQARVWKEMRKQVMIDNNLDEDALATKMTPAEYATFVQAVSLRAHALLNGEPYVDANDNGQYDPDLGETYTDVIPNGAYDWPLLPMLLAPEIIAGRRMDVNRPFGDGRDNNNNGIVDEPAEAGEPFVDTNGDGKRNDGTGGTPVEPYADLDGDGQYTPALDTLWQGLTAEPISFDYLHGNSQPPIAGRLRDVGVLQRQAYARQLYCLMMLLTDEYYIDSQNVVNNPEGNINLLFLVDRLAREIAAKQYGTTNLTKTQVDAAKPAATLWALRKLTARRIAQWAINCVDFRDADDIMTPFEYDENPFDGWGVVDNTDTFVPLDGNVATNENWGTDQTKYNGSNANDDAAPASFDGLTREMATRDVVWGTERPELLITETLALHDRRCTDEQGTDESGAQNASVDQSADEVDKVDLDLDQKLKPRGSLFVELYNPWSPDGQKPAELYGRTEYTSLATGNVEQSDPGVILNRLSNVGLSVNPATSTPFTDASGNPETHFSPVWRLSVLRDPIGGRLTDPSLQLLQTDADGFGVDLDRDAERWVYFTTGGDTYRDDDNTLYDGPHADYNNVSGTLTPKMDNLKVWVPPLRWREGQDPQTGTPIQYATTRRYFIARTDVNLNTAVSWPGNDQDVAIAPILPGRYALVGSAGLQLTGTGISGNNTPATPDGQLTTRFVTSIGRLPGTGSLRQTDQAHRQQLGKTRRIELWPLTDPDAQQVLIGNNGGQEFVQLGTTTFVNVTDSDLPGDPNFGVPGRGAARAPWVSNNKQIMQAAVAIPVEDMNISEPPEGYPSYLYQREYFEANGDPLNRLLPAVPNSEGELEYAPDYYDRPLDMEFDLVRNGTTQKYRTLHLQRLANPTLPWNPAPFDDLGTANPLHNPSLPVNPYRTIDSQSVDLTAFNGASDDERMKLPSEAAQSMGIDNRDLTQEDIVAPLPVEELETAPDHVLWAVLYMLDQANIAVPAANRTPAGFRKLIELNPDLVESYLSQLETAKGGNETNRGELLEDRVYMDPNTGEPVASWDGQWGWHLFRRVLPEDSRIPIPGTSPNAFRQRLNMKSLERGGHTLALNTSTTQWELPSDWIPRLLWKQERPNFMLLGPPERVSDLKNVRSRRFLRGDGIGTNDYQSGDDVARSNFFKNTYAAGDPTNYPNGMFDVSNRHVVDFVLEGTLGFANEAYAPNLDRTDGDAVALVDTLQPGAPQIVDGTVVATPEANEVKQWNPSEASANRLDDYTTNMDVEWARRRRLTQSTYPWMAWDDRPFVSADEIMQVPASSSSLMLREYSVITSNTPNPYDGSIKDDGTGTSTADRYNRQQAPFGHLLNFFLAAPVPATAMINSGNIELTGAPNYARILDYVEVPSRYVGTDTMLDPNLFNDNPFVDNTMLAGEDILGQADPRYNFQPPFNKVSRERDPGKVNLNTVIGRREYDPTGTIPPHIWSEVYDGIMHRYQDGNWRNGAVLQQYGQFGPAWRDVTLSRRGYAQSDAIGNPVDQLGTAPNLVPDTLTFGLNPNSPTFFANPFRSPDAGDLVPLASMVEPGVQASWQRSHPYLTTDPTNPESNAAWGTGGNDDNMDGLTDDQREAGFGDDVLSAFATPGIPSGIPLFAETAVAPAVDGKRNPYMMYQPMTRLGNLVTTRSGVYAIWITVGYFEVEPAPDWNDSDSTARENVRRRFGAGDAWNANPADNTADARQLNAANELYDKVYPQGYMLGREMGIDTGEVKRQRGFYIIDRTQPVGFKPGEDLNVEDTIRVRRRVE